MMVFTPTSMGEVGDTAKNTRTPTVQLSRNDLS